ncbi:MAG: N-acetylmuramoyl-L-alanine amidase [Muribaculaceae bacterium]|nr:N-acetylmuramoyl-L-alanine amidase [Muribaculaceae bacterium]
MKFIRNIYIRKIFTGLAFAAIILGLSFTAMSKSNNDFVVIIDPGHGGKDHGAIDNNAREKDINLAVAQRLGELIEKKIKNSDVVFTRNNDTFVSLQGRADIANKAKGDLFISIHTNSVDTKNKNRSTVAGASVYTLGPNKEGANMDIARRENAVIELENGYHQKYSGFDPNKDESYIIFEMAQKQNIAQSNRFAKMVQDNLVKIAGRKDRGVHQAGFWVLWSTSMPSVLVELDFICNPESAKFMTSKEGVNKLAEAIFEAVKIYEMNYRQSQRMADRQEGPKDNNNTKGKVSDKTLVASNRASKEKKIKGKKSTPEVEETMQDMAVAADEEALQPGTLLGLSFCPDNEVKDLSHSQLQATRNQKKARHASDGRKRRSAKAREISDSRNVEGAIALRSEYTGKTESVVAANTPKEDISTPDSKSKNKKKSKKKVSTKKVAEKKTAASSSSKEDSEKLSKEERKRIEKERKAQEAADRQVAAYKARLAKEEKKREKERAKKADSTKDNNPSSIVKTNKDNNSVVKSSGQNAASKRSVTSKESHKGYSLEESSDPGHAAKRKSLKSKSTN